MRYRKIPVVIEAVQYDGKNIDEIQRFAGDKLITLNKNMAHYSIKTLEGNMMIKKKDFIIKGVKGEFYPCKPDIFRLTYEFEE